jgi:hypothetical protein
LLALLSELTRLASGQRGRLHPGFRRFGRPRRRQISLQCQLGNLHWQDSHLLDHQLASLHYPNALVSCPLTFTTCALPAEFSQGVTHDLSAFNLLNRDNQRVTITSNGLVNNAITLVTNSVVANIAPYSGYYELPTNFMKPTAAYSPRQVQLSLKFVF